MNGGLPNSDTPDLRIGTAGQQALASRKGVVRHLEGAGIHIDGYDLVWVSCFHLRAHLLLVNGRAAAGVFFLAVPRLSYCHEISPAGRRLAVRAFIVAILASIAASD